MKRSNVLRIVLGLILSLWIAGCRSHGDHSLTAPTSVDNGSQKTGKVTVHAILCIADQDPIIGTSTTADLNSMTSWLNDITQNTSFPVEQHLLTGLNGQLSLTALQATIQNLDVGKNDVIIFYYSGHGGNLAGSQWPAMKFLDNLVNFGVISDTLRAKGANLTLALVDCCNNYSRQMKQIPLLHTRNANNWQVLFQKSGHIVASAASPGEYSVGYDTSGGAFTQQFLA
jgi:hypothetical protein